MKPYTAPSLWRVAATAPGLLGPVPWAALGVAAEDQPWEKSLTLFRNRLPLVGEPLMKNASAWSWGYGQVMPCGLTGVEGPLMPTASIKTGVEAGSGMPASVRGPLGVLYPSARAMLAL